MPMLYRYSVGDLRNVALLFLGATDTRTLNLWWSILVLRQCKFIISFSLLLFMPMLYRCLAGDLCNVALSFLGTTDTRTLNLWRSILVLRHCKFLISFSLFLFMPMVYSVWLVIHATSHCCFSELLTHLSSSDPNFYFIVKWTKDKDNPGPYWTCLESMFSQRMR